MAKVSLEGFAWMLGAVVLAQGCGDDGAATPADTTSGTTAVDPDSSTASSADTSSSASTGATTTTADGSSDTGFEPPVPACGNGFVEVGEDCDDGNDESQDACPNDCIFACSLEWTLVRSGPTQESDIYGVSVATDAAGLVYALAYQREIDVDPKGMQSIGDVSSLLIALDDAGAERWSTSFAEPGFAVRPGAVALDDGGAPYVTITREVAAGGTDVQVLRLDPRDGAIVWTHDVVSPVVDGDDVAEALAIGPDGDIVVAATVAVGDGDDDAWTRKLAAADGTEVWTSSFDGPSEGAFSTDNAGPVAIGADGTVAVLAQAYVDFSTAPATLLVYPAEGGEPLWTWTPPDDGGSQELTPIGVGIDDEGNVYAAYQRTTSVTRFWVAKFDSDGTSLWLLGDDHFLGADQDWTLSGFGLGPNGPALIGSYTAGDGADAWIEGWVAQVDPEAAPLCLFTIQGEGGGVLPPGLLSQGGAVAGDGKVLSVGQWIDDAEEAMWVARLRAFGR
jgi:cysteine-rich repeat protein